MVVSDGRWRKTMTVMRAVCAIMRGDGGATGRGMRAQSDEDGKDEDGVVFPKKTAINPREIRPFKYM